ncbi:Clavaminate synthase-like protein [Imleria badia]|nr:Clavaminate synthase-like protein [Imleria badia]
MPGTALPPFPADVRTHPLLVIDYDLLKAGDSTELDRLWEAATSIGFWYLKNHGADKEVSDMFNMGAETMALPLEERLEFEQGDEGRSFGYKKAGANAVDASGQLDAVDFINVAKDDALAFPNVIHRTYPAPTTAAMPTAVTPFVRKSLEINSSILRIFNDRLGLPEGTLDRLHSLEEHSGSEARVIRAPPMPGKALADTATLGAHTDFGSLSFLHNKLGGLQVMPPGHTEWCYVKPLPGHAICNIGDALSVFSGGILQSNIHRVVPPPGIQAEYERWSLVFFTRPGNSGILRALVEDSPLIAASVQKHPDRNFDTGSTAGDWFARRIKYQRINNRKGPETWAASRGTEHTPTVA